MNSSKDFENFAKKTNCDCCHCKRFRYPRSTSAKTSSVWRTRNDSSNVSSLLAPDLEQASEKSTSTASALSKPVAKRTIKSAALASKSSEVTSHCEDCYCRHSPNLPLLNLRTRDVTEEFNTNARRSLYCPCRGRGDHGVRRLPKEPERKTMTCPCACKSTDGSLPKNNFNFTSSRHKYETKSGNLYRIDELEEQSDAQQDYRSEETATNVNEKPKTYADFKDIAKFRKEQYFDCHGTNDIGSSGVSQPHKCIHKFAIDDRLLPQPLNSDAYGVSRCDVCDRSMETFKSERARSETAAKSVNKVKEIYEYNLAPHRLNIGCGKETVEIRVPQELAREVLWRYNTFKIKRRVPGNSFALRYQRGRV